CVQGLLSSKYLPPIQAKSNTDRDQLVKNIQQSVGLCSLGLEYFDHVLMNLQAINSMFVGCFGNQLLGCKSGQFDPSGFPTTLKGNSYMHRPNNVVEYMKMSSITGRIKYTTAIWWRHHLQSYVYPSRINKSS
ncbi:hypothetical protein BDQ12DRAFT_671969, partial [Crucibulum laeve]